MRRIRLLPELLAWSLLATQNYAYSGAARAQDQAQPAKRTETEGTGPDSAFGEVRRLSQQGKYDEALAQLHDLAAKQLALKGLSHEFGVTYFKKADYLKAVESFKKALEEDPKDNEAIQLMGLSYYLAGKSAEAIGPLEQVQTWYALRTWMRLTFSVFAMCRRETTQAHAKRSQECLLCRPIPPPATCLRPGCCCGRILDLLRRNTQKRRWSWIPNFRWLMRCSGNSISTSSACRKRSNSFRKN